jgi:hypothetical protein
MFPIEERQVKLTIMLQNIECVFFFVFFYNNVIYFIQMLAAINTPKVQAPFGVSLLHPVLIGHNVMRKTRVLPIFVV